MLTKLGYGGFYMMNLFTIISSDPAILKELYDFDEFVCKKGEMLRNEAAVIDNTLQLEKVSKLCKEVIFAWGNFKEASLRDKQTIYNYPNALCFGKSKTGAPLHPLALMYNGTQSNPKLIKY